MTRLSARPPIISIINRAAQWPLDDNTCWLFLCVCVWGFIFQVHFHLYFVNKKESTNLNNCLRNRVINSLSYVVDWFSFKKKKQNNTHCFLFLKRWTGARLSPFDDEPVMYIVFVCVGFHSLFTMVYFLYYFFFR